MWAYADDHGVLKSDISSGTFSEAASAVEGRRTTLVVPGDDVLLAEATVPGGSLNRALQAVPFALEDQVADDIDSLHFALGARGKDDKYPVAVIGRETMNTVSEQCVEAGLRPSEIVPETLALPKFEGSDVGETAWTALLDNQQAVVRLNGYKGFSTDISMASIMLNGARQDLPQDTNASMVLFRTDPNATLSAPPDVDVETRACDSRLGLYASGLASSPHINLLQGAFSPKAQFDKAWKPWRWTLALAACLGIALFAGKWIDNWHLSREVAAIDAQIAQAFQQAMPGSRMQRPRAQIKARLKQLSGGSTDGFTDRLGQLAASLATQSQTRVNSISFRNGRFDLDLTTDALPTLDKLKSELQSRGSLSMTVQSANREKDGLRSRIRVE